MNETLRIDAPLLQQAGSRLQAVAAAIPPPPAAFSPAGADALSVAIAGKVAEVVDPVLAQLPVTKEQLTRYALNVLAAAGMYDATDRQLAEEILKRLGEFDEGRTGAGSVGGGGGAGAAGSATGASTAGAGAATTGADAADPAGQMGQMMQVPMQMAQQAAQIPMQIAGMAGAIPAAMMQGVQSAMQQVGQLSEISGVDDELKPEAEQATPAETADEKRPGEENEPRVEGATPGSGGVERAPEPQAQEVEPRAPAAPKPAPTRPAEASPEIAL